MIKGHCLFYFTCSGGCQGAKVPKTRDNKRFCQAAAITANEVYCGLLKEGLRSLGYQGLEEEHSGISPGTHCCCVITSALMAQRSNVEHGRIAIVRSGPHSPSEVEDGRGCELPVLALFLTSRSLLHLPSLLDLFYLLFYTSLAGGAQKHCSTSVKICSDGEIAAGAWLLNKASVCRLRGQPAAVDIPWSWVQAGGCNLGRDRVQQCAMRRRHSPIP